MSKGHFEKKKNSDVPVWMIAGIVLVALAVVVVIVAARSNNQAGKDNQVMIDGILQTKPIDSYGSDALQTTIPNIFAAEPTDRTESIDSDTEPEETYAPVETQEPHVEPTHPSIVIIQRADAEYEKWLSAAMIVCVSMEYPDFALEGVYAASATALEDKFESDGAYIIFSTGGTHMAIHSTALEGERTDPGTVDISTETIGYATFDQVDPDMLDLSSMEQINLEDLSELISQSLLISIYTH